MKTPLIGYLLFVLSLTSFTYAEAEESSFYAGAGYGRSWFTGETVTGEVFIPGQKLKDHSDTFSIFLGFQLNKYFSFEIRYIDLGKVFEKYALDPDVRFIVAPNDTDSIEIDGFTIAPLFEYPIIDSLSLLGLLGFSYLNVDRDVSGGFIPGSSSFGSSSSDTHKDIFYGAGLKYKITNNLKIRLQWEHYDVDVAEVNVGGISLEYRF